MVHAVDAATGKAVWTYKTGSEIKSSPVVAGDKLLNRLWTIQNLYAFGAQRRQARVVVVYVAHAKTVAAALSAGLADHPGVPWFRVHPEPPHTHQFQVWLPYEADVLNEAALRQAEESGVTLFRRWFPAGPEGPPGVCVTEVTVSSAGMSWTAEDVRTALAEFLSRVRAG